ncbi:MAG: hypothetical protein KatS3mg057_0871 [Herpetosiphonaceae bacterium]|nr:MAG: hypothetical protein KatS3mg057_0871 [Herpetosiphonaceae bacterium]
MASQQKTINPQNLPTHSLLIWWRRWEGWLLAFLVLNYAVFQLLTGVQYGDAPRNLHWELYLLEQPRFLLDAEDSYDRINGFPPSPPSLAPSGSATGRGGPLHPWWGPLYPALFAALWWLTGSYTTLHLVVPLAAGAVVLLTYAFGLRYFSRSTALLAAVLLALFPTYREHAPLAFVEPLSALLLFGALWAFLARRSALTGLLGALAVLGKIDLIFLYYGSLGLTALLGGRESLTPAARRHLALSLGLPLLALLPWLYLAYIVSGRATTVSGGPRLDAFLLVAPIMLEQLFTIRWPGALLTLAALGVPLGLALRRRAHAAPQVYRLLAVWLALGWVVLLVYSATPGASNNPRVVIPALPPLALLVADGLTLLQHRWRLYLLCSVLTLFLLMNGAGVLYQLVLAQHYNASKPVWETLHHKPRGVIMTEHYWHAALYARQPVTWFEKDPVLQRNMLHNLEHFKRYISDHPIRYIVLPRNHQTSKEKAEIVRIYEAIPIGRMIHEIRRDASHLTSPEVRLYLETRFSSQEIGDFIVFTLY